MKSQKLTKPKQSVINKAKADFASLLKAKREAAGISQELLANTIGVDRKTINRIENGHFSPSLDTMIRIATVLKLKPQQMISIGK